MNEKKLTQNRVRCPWCMEYQDDEKLVEQGEDALHECVDCHKLFKLRILYETRRRGK